MHKQNLIILAITLILLAFMPAISVALSMAAPPIYKAVNGFVIVDGVLIKYTGTESEVIIPNGVKSIGNEAFSEGTYGMPDQITYRPFAFITSIIIPDSVTSIGRTAFAGCASLTSISIPDSVKSIGAQAFAYCDSLTSVIIPDGVTNIEWETFRGCTSLSSIVIPNSVTSIGSRAFSDCTALTSIVIPDSVTSIDPSAFDHIFNSNTGLTSITVGENNLNYSSIDGVLFNKNKTELIKYPIAKPETNYNIPDGVITIAELAFKGCSALKSIVIPDSVTSIKRAAFAKCNELELPLLPRNVASIGESIFSDCQTLTLITVSEDNPEYLSIDGVLFNKDKNVLMKYPAKNPRTSYDIPSSVTSINGEAFENCEFLTSIVIPNSFTSIVERAFSRCHSLKSIVIPDSVTSIEDVAFINCTSLKSIVIPDSVTNIGDGVFYDCDKLTIHGARGSYAEKYARENKIKFKGTLRSKAIFN